MEEYLNVPTVIAAMEQLSEPDRERAKQLAVNNFENWESADTREASMFIEAAQVVSLFREMIDAAMADERARANGGASTK